MINDRWQEQIVFTPDQLLVGTGWHEVEKEGETFIRWSGPDTTSTIQLNPRRDHGNRVNLTIHAAGSEEILSSISLEADGVPLYTTLGKKRNPAFITAILPEDTFKKQDEQTVLTLKVPKTLPARDVLGNKEDERSLGICIKRIDIFPLQRSMFTAQKYDDPVPFDGLNYIRQNPGVREAVIHGVHNSAYEYFIGHERTGAEDAFELHEKFDECPGDLYDILSAEMNEKCRKVEEKYQEELKILRDMVYRQGDAIREMKKG